MSQFMADAGAHAVVLDMGIVGGDTRARFAAYERALRQPANELQAKLESKDPEGTALVYAGSFTTVKSLCGRRIIGARRPSHLEAERKDRQHELFGLGGRLVHLADGLKQAPVPAVVQGIPDHGVAMATSHTYLLPRSPDSRRIRELAESLKQDCKRAVVTAFHPGLPCTFYGFITTSGIVDLGPVEALVYWDPRTWRIHAPGIVTPLSVPEGVVTSAREEAHAVAQRLHHQLGYVGAFGTDGVINNDRYVIHEINPRVCAGFSLLDHLAPDAAPLAAVDLVLRELPGASAVLNSALTSFATWLQRNSAHAYRLWESPQHSAPVAARLTGQPGWAQHVRKMASGGLRPISQMEDQS